jgi:hypothetical protein
MSNNNESFDKSVFEEIPESSCSPEQITRWRCYGGSSKTYVLLRDPSNLDEIRKLGQRLAIWRENQTLTYVSWGFDDGPLGVGKYLHCGFDEGDCGFNEGDVHLYIGGSTHDAMAQTAAFFLSLVRSTSNFVRLLIANDTAPFRIDLSAAQSQCFVDIFEAIPSLHLEFQAITLSAAQSVALATRPHPVTIKYYDSVLADGGTAFVNALQDRKSSFGSLTVEQYRSNDLPLNVDNLRRLLQVETIEHLGLPLLFDNELVLLPFSAKADSLFYEFRMESQVSRNYWESLCITATKLSLTMFADEPAPSETIILFWRRIASLGHFVELKFEYEPVRLPLCVIHEMTRAALANKNLKVLDLAGVIHHCEDYLKTLFNGLKYHQGLRCLRVYVENDKAFDSNFSELVDFLSHHRNIEVTDCHGTRFSDGLLVDALYSLNKFYRGSSDLVVAPLSEPERNRLVTTALVEQASKDFQRSALLLSNHLDTLCGLVQLGQLAETDGDDFA